VPLSATPPPPPTAARGVTRGRSGPLCITIIGIPFGVATFKLAGLALVPFGKIIVTAGAPLPPNATVYLAV
jgi:Inner membrane component domain